MPSSVPESPSTGSADNQIQQPKGRAAPVACESCRSRKRKCDRVRPVCGTCAKKTPNTACVFDTRRGGKTLSYINALHNRIRELEEAGESSARIQPNTPEYDRTAQSPLLYQESTSQLRAQEQQRNQSPTDSTEQQLNHNFSQPSCELPGETEKPAQNSEHHAGSYNTFSHPSSYQSWGSQNILQRNAPQESAITSSNDILTTSLPRESGIEDGNQGSSPARFSDHLTVEQTSSNGQVGAAVSVDNNADHGGDQDPLESPEYFGSSSTYTFMSQVQNVLDTTHSWPDGAHSIGSTHDKHIATEYYPEGSKDTLLYLKTRGPGRNPSGSHSWMNKSNSRFEKFSIPPRRDSDALVESYWTWLHNLYPFLDAASFTSRYDQLWSSSNHDLGDSRLGSSSKSESSSSTKSGANNSENYSEMDKILFHSLLNMVFALGSQVNPSIDPDKRWIHSDLFYQRAKRLIELDFDIMSQGSIPLIQTFLLMGQYLQSADMSGACWNCIGVAIRAAQSIGLHVFASEDIEPDNVRNRSTTVPRVEQQQFGLRRRLWGGCVMFDRILSMIYGRPCMITPTLPMQPVLPFLDDKNCFGTYSLPEGHNSTHLTTFFIHALKLVEVLGDISGTFYRSNDRHSPLSGRSYREQRRQLNARENATEIGVISIDDFYSLLKHDLSLTAWHDNLPDHLKVTSANPAGGGGITDKQSRGSSISDIISRQRNILQARFLHARIYMFRPLLLRSFSSQQRKASSNEQGDMVSSDFQRALFGQASKMCVSAAQDLITIIADNMDSVSGMLPEWWNNTYLIYTCATVILVACLCPSIRDGFEIASLKSSWNKCLASLKADKLRSRSAWRCYQVLELIDHNAFRARSTAFAFGQNTASSPVNPMVATAYAPNNVDGVTDFQSGRGIPSVAMDGVEGFSDDRPFFSTDELGLNFFRPDLMNDPLDIEWLSSIPFDMDFPDWNTAPNGVQ